jgi:T5SS/PEP-CTERM-associated repeat protein/autotransporter-associated beta strand protein
VLLATSSLAAVVLGWGGAAQAQSSWQGTTSTDWFTATNWAPNAVPTAADKVVVDQGTPNANPVIGINGTSNAALSNTAVIGDLAGTTGAVTVNTTNAGHPASWTLSGDPPTVFGLVPGSLVVGGSGTGSLTITNGGTVTTTGHVANVVIGSVGTGTVTVGSATAPNLANLSILSNNGPTFSAGSLIVGDTGNGTLIVNPDGVVRDFIGARIAEAPGSQGTVVVNGGSMNVIDPHFGLGGMAVGLAGHGTLTVQNGGTLTGVDGSIALFPDSAGSSVTVTGANSVWNITGGNITGGLTVGSGDAGSLSILAGGTVNAVGSPISIGSLANSFKAGLGTVTVDNGSLNARGGNINIGVDGIGTSIMTVQNGGHVTSDSGEIGGFAPASFNGNPAAMGAVTVAGSGSLWDAARNISGNVDATSQLFVDNPTSMTGLVIKQGGQVISGAGFVGDFSPGSVNTVVVDGAGSNWTNLTSLSVGYFQPGFSPTTSNSIGIVNITNGGQVSAPTVNIGVLPDSSPGGTVDLIAVSGAGSKLLTPTTLSVGLFGTGNLTVSGGATVTSGAGIIGFSSAAPGSLNQTGVGPLDTNNIGADSVGTALVTGAGSTWTTNSLIVGDNATTDPSGTFTGIGGGTATGVLIVADGAVVNVAGGAGTINVALNAGSTGTINIGAPVGQAAAAPGTVSAATILFGAGTGSLVFNHTSNNYIFAPSIQGAGSVDVESGTTILTAVSTYSGPTIINGGKLFVDGSAANSSMTVNTGGVLGGAGVVGSVAVNGGTLAPGSPAGATFGPLTVQGSLSFTTASTYLIQIASANAGRTNVTGTATLGGGTVDAMFAPGGSVSRQYTILNATGGVSGTFNPAVVTNSPNLSASLSYDAHDVFLNVQLTFAGSGGLNGNQQAVGNALTNFFNANGGISSIFVALTPAGLTQADGELATGSQQTTFDAMGLFMGLLTDPFFNPNGGVTSPGGPTAFANGDPSAGLSQRERDAYAAVYTKAPPLVPFDQRWNVWAAGFGGSQTTDGNAVVGSNSVTSRIFGGAAGADYRFSPNTLAGFALAGGGTSFSLDNALGTGRSDLFQAGVYLHHRDGPAYINAALAYGWQHITTDRTVTIAGLDKLHAEFDANAWSGRLEGGYRFATPWMIGITPYAAAQFVTFDLPAYAETALVGTNNFALAYGAKSVTDPRTELGLRSDKSFAMADGVLTLRGRLAWAHDYNRDRNIGATFQALPGASFVVNGAMQASDSALTTASAEVKWRNGWAAAATFEGEFSDVTRSYAGKGVVRYSW